MGADINEEDCMGKTVMLRIEVNGEEVLSSMNGGLWLWSNLRPDYQQPYTPLRNSPNPNISNNFFKCSWTSGMKKSPIELKTALVDNFQNIICAGHDKPSRSLLTDD